MDVSNLIVLVEKYPELYNMRHPEYFNNVRRENIWEEIGASMKQSGAECKDRCAKVRDNHRKALQRRRTKSGQAAKRIKPPKYEQELTFLVPYIIDEENRNSNFTAALSPAIQNEEERNEIVNEEDQQNYDYDDNEEDDENAEISGSPSVSVTSNFPTDDSRGSRASPATSSRASSANRNIRHPQKRNRSGNPRETTAANVLQEFLAKKHQTCQPANAESDPLSSFFMSMAKTVKGFPLRDQIDIKKKIFQLVSDKEMDIAMRMCEQPPSTNSITVPNSQQTTTEQLLQQPGKSQQPALQTTGQFFTGGNNEPYTLKNYYTWGWQDSQK